MNKDKCNRFEREGRGKRNINLQVLFHIRDCTRSLSLFCILYLPSFVFIVNSCLMVFNLYVSIYFMLFFLAYNFSLRQFHQQYAVATVSSIVTTVRSLDNGGAVVSFVWNFFSCVYNFCSFVGPRKMYKKIDRTQVSKL